MSNSKPQAGAAPRRPNILFLYPDQWRYDWVEWNPALPVRTPNVARLARQGARFDRAVTPSPVCAPARACLASGKDYDRCRTPSNNVSYPLDQTTIYTLLRDAGSRVLGCGKFDLDKPILEWGLDGKRLIHEWGFSDGIDNEGKMDAIQAWRRFGGPTGPYMALLKERGFAEIHVEDMTGRKERGTDPTPLPEELYCDNWLAENGLRLLRETPPGQPWFLQVNFTGPHLPFDVTRRMRALWEGVDFPPANHPPEGLTAQEINRQRQNYSAMTENIDRLAGLFLDEVERRGELDNTLIVFSSDHGEMLGDHGRYGKSRPHHPSTGVPLVASGPGVAQGLVHADPATILDLAATFLDYAGVDIPPEMDSRSLRPLLEGREERGRSWVRSGLNGWRMVYDGRHKLIRGLGEGLTLFDLQEDPLENRDMAAERPEIVRRMQEWLDS